MLLCEVMGELRINDEHWPLSEVTFPREFDDAEFDRYLSYLTQNLTRTQLAGTKNALLFDASAAPAMSAQGRRRMAEWIEEHRDRTGQYCAGYAFVITSGFVRGLLNAILWLAPTPAPHTVVATREQGLVWLRNRLREEGVHLPTEVNQLAP